MKTNRTLLFAALAFLFSSVLLSQSSYSQISREIKNNSDGTENYCTCTCEACKDCRHKEPDKEKGNFDDYRIMNKRDFAEFKQLIADRTFESTKLEMTKSVIDNNYFSTEQVKDMLTWFSFESNKLDIAKYAFKNTADYYNYYKLYNSFVFESYVTELDDYIKNYRH